MTDAAIQSYKKLFIETCHNFIQRPGLDKLLDYLEKSDFYTAPSSSSFHLNEAGGLCRHSLNVFETALSVYQQVVAPRIANGSSPFSEEVSEESIAIAALFHDLCKIKFYHPTQKWKKDENDRWMSYMGYKIEDDFPFGHGEKSALIAGWFMRLKPAELLAIRWHMGMFDMGEAGSNLRRSFYAAMEKSPLVSLLHAADMIASNCLEKTVRF